MDSRYIVKIADFGMSRNICDKSYYKMADKEKPLPIRWLAVECMETGEFNEKTDVVSKNYLKIYLQDVSSKLFTLAHFFAQGQLFAFRKRPLINVKRGQLLRVA